VAKLIYLSPYYPDFSPIQIFWSKLKNILCSIKTTNYQELGKAIEFAFNEVTEQKYFERV
jgi:transposase